MANEGQKLKILATLKAKLAGIAKLNKEDIKKWLRQSKVWLVTFTVIFSIIVIYFKLQYGLESALPLVLFYLMGLGVFFLLLLIVRIRKDSDYKKEWFAEERGLSFIVKGVLVPLFVGFIAIMVSENINPKKIPVTIVLGGAYSGYQAAYKAEFKDDFLDPAIQSLGDYEKTLALNVIEVGPYDQILADATTGKADLATLPPFAYIFYNWYFGEDKTFDINLVPHENPMKNIMVIGYKNTSQRGNFYKGGLLFSKAKNDSLAGKSAEEIIADVKRYNEGKVFYSKELLSTSGNNIAKTWLLSQGCADLWLKGTRVASSEMLESLCATSCKDTCNCANKAFQVGFFSSDQWDILKRYNPQEARKFNWVPIRNIPIPYEPVLVNREEWNRKFDSGWQRLWDMLTLRKLDFRKSRKDVILESLQTFMTPIKEESEWMKNNQVFADLLRSGVVDDIDATNNRIYIWFPVPEDSDGKRLWYDTTSSKLSNLCFYQLDKNPDYNRFDVKRTLNYPMNPKNDNCSIKLNFKAISNTTNIDKGVLCYEFSYDEADEKLLTKFLNNRWFIIPDDRTCWTRF